jgi:hypothetical protein
MNIAACTYGTLSAWHYAVSWRLSVQLRLQTLSVRHSGDLRVSLTAVGFFAELFGRLPRRFALGARPQRVSHAWAP